MRRSGGKTGACWVNAVAQGFFSELKNELFQHTHLATRARFDVINYIEVFYNRRRLQSFTPMERSPHYARQELPSDSNTRTCS